MYYKIATPTKLNNRLLQSECFSSDKNYKLIPSVVSLLNFINQCNYTNADKFGYSEIAKDLFEDRYRGKYTSIISALETLGLLKVDRMHRGRYKGDRCFGYKLTSDCVELLKDQNKEYLYLVLNNKKLKARVDKNAKTRVDYNMVYGDSRDIDLAFHKSLTVDYNKVEPIISQYPKQKQAVTYQLLVTIVTKHFSFKFNEKDNRIWTPYFQLPKEIKAVLKSNDYSYQTTMDVRSCHPSLFACYIKSLNPNIDIAAEFTAYNSIFLNPNIDIKGYIAKELAIPRDEVKPVLLSFYNGKGFNRDNSFRLVSKYNKYVKYNNWLKTNYPTMYQLWMETDLRQTGNQISKHFETKLMQNVDISNKAKELDMVIGGEADGFSIFSKNQSAIAINELLEFVELKSIELLGVKLVFVEKKTNVDFHDVNAEIQATSDEIKAEKFKPHHDKWVKAVRRYWSKSNSNTLEQIDYTNLSEARKAYNTAKATLQIV